MLGKWAELNAVQKIVELSFCLEERPVTFCFVLFSFVELVVQAQISGRSLAREQNEEAFTAKLQTQLFPPNVPRSSDHTSSEMLFRTKTQCHSALQKA